MTRVTVDVVGVRVGVSADHAGLQGLDGLIVDAPSDCSVETTGTDLESILAEVTLAAVDVAPSLLFHAGAVAWNGRAAIFPGTSGAGKSTTTAACVRHGLDYVTDEMVALDLDSGAVEGFARPLMLTPWAADALGVGLPAAKGYEGKRAVPASMLGGSAVTGPLVAAHVIEVRIGAVRTSLSPVSPSATLELLLRSSFNHFRHGHAAWRAATELAERASGWRLDVADPLSSAAVVHELLGAQA